MRACAMLLAAAVAGAGDAVLRPPADPASGPLPPGLRLSLTGAEGPHRLGEPLRVRLVVAAEGRPVDVLMDGSSTPMEVRLTAPDGQEACDKPGDMYAWSGVTRLPAGGSQAVTINARRGRMPAVAGHYRLSVFADLGWGPERPGDPRRVSLGLDVVAPTAADIPGIVAAQFAQADADEDGHRTQLADLGALAHPRFVGELRRRAEAGSYRALTLLGETAGPRAAEALVVLAVRTPERRGLRGQANLGFCLLSRLGDHLPPRLLPGEKRWWEDPECSWRRETMAGVTEAILPQARAAALGWLDREAWGAAEVLVWCAQPEDRPVLLAAIGRQAAIAPPPINHLHTLWRLAYAALLAAPEVPPPDPRTGIAEAVVWACANNVRHGQDADAVQRVRELLGAPDALRRRIGMWAIPHPIPDALVPDVAQAMRLGAGADQQLVEDAVWKSRLATDPRLLDAMLAVAADPRFHQDYALIDTMVAAGRRVAMATAIAGRCALDGQQGDDGLRGIARLCLSVRPVGIFGEDWPKPEAWQEAAKAWKAWLAKNGPAITRDGPLPAGDPRQPDHVLWPRWWFEAADGRRFFRPEGEL